MARRYQTYFILARTLGRVKIGKAFDPEKRLSDLQTGSPEELELLLALPERPPFEESQLHYRFKNYRVIGEWFEYRDDLKIFITNKIADPTPTEFDDRAVKPSGKYADYRDRIDQDRPTSSKITRTPAYGLSLGIEYYDENTDEWTCPDVLDHEISRAWADEKIN